MKLFHALGALTAALSFQGVNADTPFRVTCSPFKRERIDNLVSPGQEATHMHTFWGSRAITADPITVDELRDSCHTCSNTFDHSAYWMPTLYYVKKNATLPVKVAIFHVYYHGQNEDREPFPEDFAILSGNSSLTEEQAKEQGGIGTSWFFDDSDEEKEAWQLPTKKGGGWLRGNVPFPTSVVKDETLGRYRECTSKDEAGCFNVIRMFFAVWYDLRDDYFSFEDGDYLTLSSGGGQTYHGDFIYGWDREAAYDLVRKTEGASTSNNQSTQCQALNEQDPFLQRADWDAMLEAKAGNVSIETGTYGRGLTITDGTSVNSTWTGKWGEEGETVAQPGNATVSQSIASTATSSQLAVSLSATSTLKAEIEDVTSTVIHSSSVPVSIFSTTTKTSAPISTQESYTMLQTPSFSISATRIGYAAASASSIGSSVGRTPTAPAGCAANYARKGHSRKNIRRAH
ncbi:uncharacterized protein M421DRAFT_214083 [Didymella exigua CBS 183.55]|uniref:DUF1996 domain-containing protein n=1 Tax=Didymella exigua CBS 183.55 TaxID=1150837 RepID=A0A6A5RGT0_9PLEO|nr:uncharacterized protein M421DRAFT_214083 [Didymella exigua CBS 183.55]KAF1926693.1 hypothetical protein M421DRAFT_214083 [Didymella exigua CBS 183.55]